MRIHTLIWLLLLFAIASCVDLGYREPQPASGRTMEQIPDSFNGSYADRKDTLLIHQDFFVFNRDTLPLVLSDTLVLKRHRGLFYLNSKNTQYDYWTVIAFNFRKDRLTLYAQEVEEEDLNKLERKFEVETIMNDNGNVQAYIIEPRTREWKKLLRSSFYPKKTLRKID